jgi:alpha-glucosidase (family GH31 glycosyl hydrolase)
VEDICRNYLHLRYQMLPLLYCLFAEARATGAPIMRPLLWHYQNDPVAVACGDQFLLGRDLLVAPILREGAVARSVYLPNDVWSDFWTGERHAGGTHIVVDAPLGTIPLFVRAGGIVPFGPRQQFVGEADETTVLVHCWPGAPGRLNWYEDDGSTQAYEHGQVHRRTLHSRTRGQRWSLEFSPPEGARPSSVKTWRIALWGARPSGRLTVNGRPVHGQFVEETPVLITEVPNQAAPLRIEYSRV